MSGTKSAADAALREKALMFAIDAERVLTCAQEDRMRITARAQEYYEFLIGACEPKGSNQ